VLLPGWLAGWLDQSDRYSIRLDWPTKDELWPPSRPKILEAMERVKEKTRRFLFRSSVHPWMKKYAQSADEVRKLYEDVEVPLSMMHDNAEEFEALDKLSKGYRPDPAGLSSLQEIVDRLNELGSKGPDATNVQMAMQQNCRTGANNTQAFMLWPLDSARERRTQSCKH
jgi:FAD/FMN-containing dehydrogenase